jgi:hypothetical protein
MAAEEAQLGLASTEQMLRELICRFKITATCQPSVSSLMEVEWALTLAEMLGQMDAPTREYRTVDHG